MNSREKKFFLILFVCSVFFLGEDVQAAGTADMPVEASQENVKITEGFIVKNGNTYYQYADGSYAKGMQTIEGNTYYFNSAGVMQTGITIVDGKRYYFNLENGRQEWG